MLPYPSGVMHRTKLLTIFFYILNFCNSLQTEKNIVPMGDESSNNKELEETDENKKEKKADRKERNPKNNLQYSDLEPKDVEEVVSFMAEHFYPREPLVRKSRFTCCNDKPVMN